MEEIRRTLFYYKSVWLQWIMFLDGKVVKTHCTCPDFCYRKLERDKDNPHKIKQVGYCKHLKEILKEIKKEPWQE